MTTTKIRVDEKRTTYHHNNLRDAVLERAIEFIVQRDNPNFSMRELATSLGVTHAAVYRHFADKNALLDALSKKGFEALARMQKNYQAKAAEEPIEQFHALLFAYLQFARELPGYYAVMFRSRSVLENVPTHEPHNAESLKTLHDAIKACQDSGVFIKGDVARIAAYIALAPHGLACYAMQGNTSKLLGLSYIEDMPARWLAELIVQPLLAKPKPTTEMAALFA